MNAPIANQDAKAGFSAPICSASFPGVLLYNADCLEMLPIEADAVITDPPYGIAFKHSGISYGLGGVSKTDTIIGDDKAFQPAPWLDYKIVCMWGADHYAHRLPEGSGSTGLACIRTGRKFIGVEKDPKHFATAVERIGRELQQGTFAMTPNDRTERQPPGCAHDGTKTI